MENRKATYKRKIYIFPDGEIGGLSKSGGVYQIRSPSHFINLNTTDRKTAEEEFEKLANDVIEHPLKYIGEKQDASGRYVYARDDDVLYCSKNDVEFEKVGLIISPDTIDDWEQCGVTVKYLPELDLFIV